MDDKLKDAILFPSPGDVFGNEVPTHSEFFLPMMTIDVRDFGFATTEILHFVQPIEPYDGYVGDDTTRYHNDYCRENWVGYSVKEGKYTFTADFRFFQRRYIPSHPEYKTEFYGVPDYIDSLEADLESHYEQQRAEYAQKKAEYANGEFDRPYLAENTEIGGRPFSGNWAVSSEMPLEHEDDLMDGDTVPDRYAHPLTPSNTRYRYIGRTQAWLFGAGDCTTLLFYDDERSIAVSTFDFT